MDLDYIAAAPTYIATCLSHEEKIFSQSPFWMQ